MRENKKRRRKKKYMVQIYRYIHANKQNKLRRRSKDVVLYGPRLPFDCRGFGEKRKSEYFSSLFLKKYYNAC